MLVLTGLSANCGSDQLVVTGTGLDAYSSIVVTDPASGTPSFTVTSVTADELVLTLDVPLTAGQYCVEVTP